MPDRPLNRVTAKPGFLRSREALAAAAVGSILLYILVFGTLFWWLWASR